VTRRQVWVARCLLLATLAVVGGCGGGSSAGGSPTPFGDDSTSPASTAHPTPPATVRPSTPSPTITTQPSNRLVIVNPGRFANSPAVGGFIAAVQVLFRARMTHNPNVMQGWAGALFRRDNDILIINARSAGLAMRPPGRIVVRGVRKGPIPNTTTVDACFGPTMAWYDPKRKRYTNSRPNGSPISMDMYGSGSRWLMYQAHIGTFTCATVKYPKG
jgi:hypothetical protein